ncbi:hypothetical protein GCM10007890_13760 [Methylobacterium tardum]|uniref:Uncharacterized protein n=1 Tax=Methylobacterium tardum TaxID=374432 RepID=A0AA37TJY4_9HYPH|nr:hypothetical protein GCM10007890_13760 [Methylobacterium tardum]
MKTPTALLRHAELRHRTVVPGRHRRSRNPSTPKVPRHGASAVLDPGSASRSGKGGMVTPPEACALGSAVWVFGPASGEYEAASGPRARLFSVSTPLAAAARPGINDPLTMDRAISAERAVGVRLAFRVQRPRP